VIGAAALMCVCAFAFPKSTGYFGNFSNAEATATGLSHTLGSAAGGFFAVVLLNASLIGAAALTLATSYAFGDLTSTRSSLHRSFNEARSFYLIFALLIAGAGGIVLIPHAPLGIITTAVQALAGVLLPSATVFLLLLCNDRDVLGPWRNSTWLNVLSSIIISVLVLLSLILMATTVFPKINVTRFALIGGGVLAAVLALFGAAVWRARRSTAGVTVIDTGPQVPKQQWTMPPLALLQRPTTSRTRSAALAGMWCYLVLSVGLLVVKAAELAGA
jgi:hypothetical protein